MIIIPEQISDNVCAMPGLNNLRLILPDNPIAAYQAKHAIAIPVNTSAIDIISVLNNVMEPANMLVHQMIANGLVMHIRKPVRNGGVSFRLLSDATASAIFFLTAIAFQTPRIPRNMRRPLPPSHKARRPY